jgi:hypothetical protein
MHNADMGNKTKADKARFLQGLGLERKDAAEMLGTTAASIRALMSKAKNKRGANKNATNKTKRR